MATTNMKNIAFIFARGGSKGLSKKNIKELNGKPLLEYSIDTAKKIKQIDDIFVSTDCEDIASVAKKNGVKVIIRPPKLAADDSPEWLSWRHAIEYVDENFGSFEIFISLPATSPLRNEGDVRSALDKLLSEDADICISVTPSNRSPYFNMVSMLPNDVVKIAARFEGPVFHRQDTPPMFDITTVVYVAKVPFIKNHSSIFSGKVVATVIPKKRAVDIDDIYDFVFAEAILNRGLHED